MSASAPRTLVRIDGKEQFTVNGHGGYYGSGTQTYEAVPLSWSITRNGHGVIDSADVMLSVKGNPDLAQIAPAGQPVPIRIYAGFPADPERFSYAQLQLRFVGTIDPMSPKFDLESQTVGLHCLSTGAVLAGTKTTTNLGQVGAANLGGVTTTQYVQMVAAAHNMNADVRVSSPNSLQTVYATQQIVGIHNLRIWDILVNCANVDGAYLWFTSEDNTLHYVDPAQIVRAVVPLQYGSLRNGLKSFEGEHPVQFSKNIEVEVRSYRDRVAVRSRASTKYDSTGMPTGTTVHTRAVEYTQQNFGNPGSSITEYETHYGSDGTVTTSAISGSSSSVGGETSSGYSSLPTDSTKERYVYKFHGLTQAQCDARALVIWKWLSSHEFRGTFEVPVTPGLLPNVGITTKFSIQDLPWSSFDQDYIPLRLTEAFSMSDAWYCSVIGINHRAPNGEL